MWVKLILAPCRPIVPHQSGSGQRPYEEYMCCAGNCFVLSYLKTVADLEMGCLFQSWIRLNFILPRTFKMYEVSSSQVGASVGEAIS